MLFTFKFNYTMGCGDASHREREPLKSVMRENLTRKAMKGARDRASERTSKRALQSKGRSEGASEGASEPERELREREGTQGSE